MDAKKELQTMREKMIFSGYRSKNLDEIEQSFYKKYQRQPDAFMTRSPFGITGKIENKKKIVISYKHCGWNNIFVPLKLNKSQLEETIMALGEIRNMIYVDRRKREKEIILLENKEENRQRTYARYCTYCGVQYITDVVKPIMHCGKVSCIRKHDEHIELKKELQNKARELAKTSIVKTVNKLSVPEIEMDDPYSSTLQGYVYCIRAENGLCKIGRSANVSSRFSEIVGASPVSVYLEHTVFSDNYVLAESYAHEQLSEYRHHGEWFDLPENVLDWFLSLDNYDLDTL